jgi:hypothetical protein
MTTIFPFSLAYSQVSRVELDPIRLSVAVEFVEPHVETYSKYRISFEKILLISISKTAEDEDGSYVVGKAELKLETDVQKLINNLSANAMISTSPPPRAYHFHLEGDICLDVVSEECQYHDVEEVNLK